MADTHTQHGNSAKTGPSSETIGAAGKSADAVADQMKEGARAVEAVAGKTADATRDATRAGEGILRAQIETAKQAARTGADTGKRSFEVLTQSVTRAFGLAQPNADLTNQSAENVRAVSEAASALAKGAQETSGALFDLAQRTMHSNVAALAQFAGCRSLQELVAQQNEVIRKNLQQVIDAGEVIARSSTEAFASAARAMQLSAETSARAR